VHKHNTCRQLDRLCCPLNLRPAGIPAHIWKGYCCSTFLQELSPRSTASSLSHKLTNGYNSTKTTSFAWAEQEHPSREKSRVFFTASTVLRPLSPVVSKTKVPFPGIYCWGQRDTGVVDGSGKLSSCSWISWRMSPWHFWNHRLAEFFENWMTISLTCNLWRVHSNKVVEAKFSS